jgi:hypothetical protein
MGMPRKVHADNNRETGRARLIEDHKLKRENEATHRAAL